MTFAARPRYACILVLLLTALPVSAATYTVTNTNDSGPGSLRQALLNANAAPGGHRVEFAIGSGPQTIQPVTPLPEVNWPVVIDGRTQPGYAGQPIIEINGSLTGGGNSLVSGLRLGQADVYGLVVNQFPWAGIWLGNGTIRNCYFGTDLTGTVKKGGGRGIQITGTATIGGAGANEGNLISGNVMGIVAGFGSVSIQGNTFGTNAARTAVIDSPNTHIEFQYATVSNSDVGGVAPNVFAGSSIGISIFYSGHVRIEGNWFGRTPEGRTFPIRTAVDIYQSSENTVAGNQIEGNEVGVRVSGNSLRNRITGNSITGNGFGIELESGYPDGHPTPNDGDDSDIGPNNLMNFPILSNVEVQDGQTTIEGLLTTVPNRAYRIELFSSPSCNESGHGEGKTLLDSFESSSNGGGYLPFSRTVPVAVAQGSVITATATSELEGTSEFSPCATVEGAGLFAFKRTTHDVSEGNALTVAVLRQHGAVGAASVSYSVTGGTATAADFTGGSGTLDFAAGETSKTFTIQTTEDSLFEGDETIVLALGNPTNGTAIGSPATMEIEILEDDAPPTVTLHSMQVAEGNSGTKIAEVQATLSSPATVPYSVGYEIYSFWSATPGVDFVAETGTLTFAAGESAKTIPVTIIGDTLWESNEYANVRVANGQSPGAVVTIVNDDPQPHVEAEAMSIPEGNGTSTAVITLRASQPVTGYVQVTLLGGSATPSVDFTPYSEELYFSNETTKSFPVTILGDTEPEPDEVFAVEVLSYVYGTVSRTTHMTIVNDDAGVGPAEQWIAAGTSGKFTVRLAQTAVADVTLGLATDEPSAVSLPASLVIPAGQISADFAVSALAPGRTANITVSFPPSLGGVTRSVRARTFTKATLRFSPARLSLLEGDTATVSVSLDPPASIPTTLGIRSTDAVEVPRSLTIPAGGSASLLVEAKRIGTFTIDAQLPHVHGNEVQSLYGSVIEEPTTPAILSITPSHGPTAGGTEVAIGGANLRRECVVAFGGVPAATSEFVSATAMTAVTPPHAGGNVDVTLVCGSDSFVFRNGFGYVSDAPRVSNVTPSSGTTAGGTHVRVAGTHFDGSCWLFFGRFAANDVVVRDDESITGVTPPHGAGTSDVTVRCSGGTSSLAAAFTYRNEADPAPLITAIEPAAAAPGELVTIQGLNFRPTDAAAIGSASAAIVDASPESHVVRVPELPAGPASVFVNDVLERVTTSGPLFSVLEARPPRITAVAPARVAAGAELELTGDGFRPGYTFEIGGLSAAIVSLDYTRAIVRVSPHAEAGAQPVKVHNRAGVLAALGPNVEIAGAGLVVTSADPRCALTDGGVYATIRGRGLTSVAAVTFDGVPSAEVTVVDDATLRVLVPPGAAGSAGITVSGGDGASATLTRGFTYASPFDPRGCGGRSRGVRH